MANYTRTDRVLLEVKDVSLDYGPTHVLRSVNVAITDVIKPDATVGQVVAFLGPSGIGKTQLSRIIAGLQAPTSGTVVLEGKEVKPGDVGMVFQNYPLFDFLTVADNLIKPLTFGTKTSDEILAKVNDLSRKLGILGYMDKHPHELSGGTRQRVAIAQQFMCAEHFLILDEPFSGLDPNAKSAVGNLIVELSDLHEDNCIIFTTHDIRSIKYADTVWLMGPVEGGGAAIIESYDLAAMDLCWAPKVDRKPEFVELVHHIEDRFETLR